MLLELLKRAVWALFGVPLLLGLAYLGGWWLFGIGMLIVSVALAEYYSAALVGGFRPAVALGFVVAGGLVAASVFVPDQAAEVTIALLVLLSICSLLAALVPGRKSHAVTGPAVTVFGVVCIAFMVVYMVRLRYLDLPAQLGHDSTGEFAHRMGALLLVLAPVWACDTLAFITGKAYGRRPLAPDVSPNKTIEGSIGGLLAAVLTATGLGVWLGLAWYHGLGLGLLLGVAGQLGDLATSIIKRNLGIDDFSSALGVHGGFLDRFDGMLLNTPLAYYYLQLVCFFAG